VGQPLDIQNRRTQAPTLYFPLQQEEARGMMFKVLLAV
jgi:hypothetical protein